MKYCILTSHFVVLEEQEQNLDVMMALAQVYEEIGEEEKAFDLVTHGNWLCVS